MDIETIAALVAIVISVSGAVIPWLTWKRETIKDEKVHNSDLAKLKADIENDLWQRMKAVIDEQQERITEQDAEIEKLRAELDKAYARIRALERENRELRNETDKEEG